MSALPIYLYGADVLQKKAKPVKEFANSIIKLIYDLFETMHNANGIGLAANQVGVLERVIVIDISELEEGKGTKPIVLINPEVLERQGEGEMEEGCLSIPEIRDQVKRAETVRVRFKDANFQTVELETKGLLGRVILHEIDHLNGILFIDHLSSAKRRLLKSKLNKIKRGEVEVSYPIAVSESVKVF